MAEANSIPMTSTPIHKIRNKEQKSFSPPLLILSCFVLSIFILWVLYQNEYIRIIKSITAGFFLVFYSFELLYFDSIIPGIHPSSPLSPRNIRVESGHTFLLNYAITLMIGVFVTIFVWWYS